MAARLFAQLGVKGVEPRAEDEADAEDEGTLFFSLSRPVSGKVLFKRVRAKKKYPERFDDCT